MADASERLNRRRESALRPRSPTGSAGDLPSAARTPRAPQGALRPPASPVVQRVIGFKNVHRTVEALGQTAIAEHPDMARDEDFVVYVTADNGLAEKGAAGNTEYAALIDGALYHFGADLASVYAKAKDDKPEKLYAHVTIDPARPPSEQSAVVAHEMALHVVPFYAYRNLLLGGASEELDVAKSSWPEMVTSGALSEELQHDRFGGGNVALYAAMIKAQMGRITKPADKGKLVFYFLGDYLSKLNGYKKKYAQSEAEQKVVLDEMDYLLALMDPFEDSKSDKSELADRFDAILVKISDFKSARAKARESLETQGK